MRLSIPPPIVLLVAAGFMWALSRGAAVAHWVSPPWNWLGVPVAALGPLIFLAALARFRRVGTTINPLDPSKATQLVTDGIFGISRNPMYLGMLILLVGWAIWLGSASAWVVLPLFWAAITFGQIVPEERALTKLFGAQYLAYKRDVARWVGRRRARRERLSA